MNRFVVFAVGVMLLSVVGNADASVISAADIVDDWTAGIGVASGTNNNGWTTSGSLVSTGGNYSGSLTSDFTATGNWSFSTQISPDGDNDVIGIVFGWQDSSNTYILSWAHGGVSDWNGIGFRKVVSGNVTDLSTTSTSSLTSGNWPANTSYDFSVSRSGSKYTVKVAQGSTSLFSKTVTDTSFTSGKVGFDVYSQRATYGSTDFTSSAIPEPATAAIWSLLGGLALIAARPRRRAK